MKFHIHSLKTAENAEMYSIFRIHLVRKGSGDELHCVEGECGRTHTNKQRFEGEVELHRHQINNDKITMRGGEPHPYQ